MSDSEQESYEVEEIQDKRKVVGGGWLYYVKWVGWPSNSNTWEPPEHLETCLHLVKEFERKVARKAEKKEARMREDKERKEMKLPKTRQRELVNTLSEGLRDSSDKDHNDNQMKNIQNKGEKEGRKKLMHPKIISSDSSDDEPEKRILSEKKFPSAQNQVLGRIVGVTKELDELYFYVEYKAKDGEKVRSNELISAAEAYEKMPQMCMQFYEEHLLWSKKNSAIRGIGC